MKALLVLLAWALPCAATRLPKPDRGGVPDPDDQRKVLFEIGAWLQRNGEAVYGTHAWTRFGEGDWRFTVKNTALYAIGKPVAGAVTLPSVTLAISKVERVELVGDGSVPFTQHASGLHLQIDNGGANALPVALKILGLHLQ